MNTTLRTRLAPVTPIVTPEYTIEQLPLEPEYTIEVLTSTTAPTAATEVTKQIITIGGERLVLTNRGRAVYAIAVALGMALGAVAFLGFTYALIIVVAA